MITPPDDKPQKAPRRGIYILPNLFTTAALFAGFFAIIKSIDGQFDQAVFAIFIAMAFDTMDGRVARITNTESEFGAQYDSLADLVSFGLAPALLVYLWSLHSLGRFGWAAAFIYMVFAAMRLARFNTEIEASDKSYFKGLPSPSAAALLAGLVWMGNEYNISGESIRIPAMLITGCAGVLMFSNIRYWSFKEKTRRRVPVVQALVLVLVLIAIFPAEMIFGGFLVYAISGPIVTMLSFRKRKALKSDEDKTAEEEVKEE